MNTDRSKSLLPPRARLLAFLALAICHLSPVAVKIGSGAQGKENPELQRIFLQMEAAGRNFRSFEAKISEKKYTAVLKEFGTAQTGEFYLARAKDGSTMMRQDISSPGRVILTIKGDLLTRYWPNLKEAQVANLGKHKDKAAELLALGIGRPPTDMQKSYDISYQGEESVGGVACSVLVLKPKNPQAAALYTTIVWWVDKSTGIPIQHKLQELSNDYLLVTFSNEKLNSKIPDSKFEQKLPNDVKVQRLQ